MEIFWNKLSLQRPTANTWKVPSYEVDAVIFLKIVNKIINDLESQGMLHFEAALLGRLIYRMKCKFRNDKGLKNMEKINRALLNYLKLSLKEDYKYLKECTIISNNINFVTLPTKQMVEYTLVRTQSFAKLMCRLENVSQEAAYFLSSRINIGQSWEVSLIALSIISRIWILARHLIKKCCDWYNSLYESTTSFKPIGANWLPRNYKLPTNLKNWLSLPWIEKDLPCIPSREEIKQNIFNLIKHSVDDSENELDFETDEIFETPKPTANEKFKIIKDSFISEFQNRKSSQQLIYFPEESIDVGKRISRDEYSSFIQEQFEAKKFKRSQQFNKNEVELKRKYKRNKEATGKLKDKIKCIDAKSLDKRKQVLEPSNLRTENDLILFLKPKTYPGMDELQWKKLKKHVRQFLVDINNSNKSVSKKRKLKMVFKKIREWTS